MRDGRLPRNFSVFSFFVEDFSFLSVCWCAVVSSSRNFFKFSKNLFQPARIGLNNGFIHWNECDTKANSLVRSGEKKEGKKSKIFSISLDIFAASCSEARKIGCYWPRVSWLDTGKLYVDTYTLMYATKTIENLWKISLVCCWLVQLDRPKGDIACGPKSQMNRLLWST